MKAFLIALFLIVTIIGGIMLGKKELAQKPIPFEIIDASGNVYRSYFMPEIRPNSIFFLNYDGSAVIISGNFTVRSYPEK